LSKVYVSLFLGMVMHDNEFKLKENKTCIKKKNELSHFPKKKNMKI